MTGIFTPPPGYGPAKLGAYAVLSFAMAAVMVAPALDRDDGIPDMSEMTEAHGRLRSVSPNKYGVKLPMPIFVPG